MEQNNESIAYNILFVSYNSEKITLVYKSKHNSVREKHIILWMIYEKIKKCNYFAVKIMLQLYSSQWLKNRGDN